MKPAIQDPKALVAGAIFIVLALAFGLSAASLPMGSAARMGPGYFPFMMAAILLVLGVGTTVEGLTRAGERPSATSLRGIALVSGSVLVFALAIRPLGLVPTVAITSFLFSMAGRDLRIVPSAIAALVMALASWLIFVVALGMPWRAFP